MKETTEGKNIPDITQAIQKIIGEDLRTLLTLNSGNTSQTGEFISELEQVISNGKENLRESILAICRNGLAFDSGAAKLVAAKIIIDYDAGELQNVAVDILLQLVKDSDRRFGALAYWAAFYLMEYNHCFEALNRLMQIITEGVFLLHCNRQDSSELSAIERVYGKQTAPYYLDLLCKHVDESAQKGFLVHGAKNPILRLEMIGYRDDDFSKTVRELLPRINYQKDKDLLNKILK